MAGAFLTLACFVIVNGALQVCVELFVGHLSSTLRVWVADSDDGGAGYDAACLPPPFSLVTALGLPSEASTTFRPAQAKP